MKAIKQACFMSKSKRVRAEFLPSKTLLHLIQHQSHIDRIHHAIAVHIANAKHWFKTDHVQQEQQVALRDSAVKIKITTAQLANVGHAVVIKVNELRQRNVVD